MPFLTPFLGEGSPTKIDYTKKGTLILTCLLEDLEKNRGDAVDSNLSTKMVPLNACPFVCAGPASETGIYELPCNHRVVKFGARLHRNGVSALTLER